MRETLKKISDICKLIFGYGIMIVLFAAICFVLYKKILPVIIYATSCLVLFGLVSMYLAGEKSLTSSSGNKYKKHLKK